MTNGNKPDWAGAPEWAKYLAQDKNGDWYWYENAPDSEYLQDSWVVGPDEGRFQEAMTAFESWKNSLEERPHD